MTGIFESKLLLIAKAPKYSADFEFRSLREALDDAAGAWKQAAAEPGFAGRAADAATASFTKKAAEVTLKTDALARMPALVTELNACLDEAWNIIDALPATGAAEQAFAAAFLGAGGVSALTGMSSQKSIQQASAQLAGARAAREAAARAGYVKLVARIQIAEVALQAVATALGQPVTADSGGDGSGKKLTLDEILKRYQVADDPRGRGKAEQWNPYGFRHDWAAWVLKRLKKDFNAKMTVKEMDMLNSMLPWELWDAYEAQRNAQGVSQDYYPTADNKPGNYDQNDAFRHAYWSALLTKRLGPDWSREFTSAHEGYYSNPGPAEAMDLYNNEVGRKIAEQHPDASEESLARLIDDAVRKGDLVTIADDEGLRWSDYDGKHAVPDSFDEDFAKDSLPGRPRSDFGVDDTPRPRTRSGRGMLDGVSD